MAVNPRRWFYIICAAAVLMRLMVFCFPFVNIDENEYAVAARILLNGGLPYRDFLVYQPPVIYYFYAATFWCLRTTAIWAPHLGMLVVVLCTCRVLWAIGRRLGSDRIGLWAAACYAVFPTLFAPSDMLGANCEILLVLPLCLALWCVLRAEEGSTPAHRYFGIAGACLGVAFLTKYPAGIFLVPCVAYTWCVSKTSAPILLAGWLLVVGVAISGLAMAGVWPETLEAFRYIVLYAKGPAQNDGVYIVLKFVFRTAGLAATGALMWWSAGRCVVHCIGRQWRFLVALLCAGFVAVLIGGRLYGHYYYLVFPFLALLAAGTLAGVTGGGWAQQSRAVRTGWATWSIACMAMALGYTGWRYLASGHLRSADWEPVAVYLAQQHRPEATLFVWGYCPQLYTRSHLRPATRFMTADYLTGRMPKSAGLEYDPATPHPPSSWRKFLNDFRDTPDVVFYDTSADIFPRAWEYLRADFARRPPDFIVDTVPSNYRRYGRYPIENFPFLQSTIERSYTKAASFNGYDIYVRKSQRGNAPVGQ